MKLIQILDLTSQATDIGSEWYSTIGFQHMWLDADITAITGGTLDMIIQALTPEALVTGARPSTTTGTDLPNMRLWDANLDPISAPGQISFLGSQWVAPAANTQAMELGQPGPLPPWFRVYMNTASATWTGVVHVALW